MSPEDFFDRMGIRYRYLTEAGITRVVVGDVDISRQRLTHLPDLRDVTINGDFTCSRNYLTTLAGSPTTIRGSFDCSKNHLRSLEGGPEAVGVFYDCRHNRLTSLKGAPHNVGWSFTAEHNRLVSLEGADTMDINQNCFLANNPRLCDFSILPRSYTALQLPNGDRYSKAYMDQYWQTIRSYNATRRR